MKPTPDPNLTLIGWREYVELPDWGIARVVAKADTGARSSAIDVSHLEELPGDRVRFEVVSDRRGSGRSSVVEADVLRRAHVKSSFGEGHDRLFVETTLKLAGREVPVQLGLVDRRAMRWRMLLGRRALEGVFAVDPGRCYLHGRRKPKKRKKKKPS